MVAAGPYQFNFDGDPATPQPWNPPTWDVAVNSRDTPTWGKLEEMEAQHGPDCSPYPATHSNSTYEGSVFICKNHVMTAINAGGYGEIVLTPDHLVDFTNGEATIRFNVSTLRTSFRDWIDITVTPFEDNMVLPLTLLPPVDLQGPPKRAIQVKMDQFNGSIFRAVQIDGFQVHDLPSNDSTSVESLVGAPSATKRTTFELSLSQSHLRFGAPEFGYNWVDTQLSGLNWTRGVVQLAHHSYNPTKDCTPAADLQCTPNTWHWSNFSISKAVPFTMLKGSPRVAHEGTPAVVDFPAAVPGPGFLRFAGIGAIDFSLDGGRTWRAANRQAQSFDYGEHFSNYWTPVPAGTKSVAIRGRDWFAGPWWVRDISIWSTDDRTTNPGTALSPEAAASPDSQGSTSLTIDPGNGLSSKAAASLHPADLPVAPFVTLGLLVAALLSGAALLVVALRRNRSWRRSK